MELREQFANDAALLLRAAQAGDAREIRAAVARMQPDLERFVRAVLSGRTLAQRFGAQADVGDVVQAVLARIIEQPPSRPTGSASPAASVLAWVKRVAIHQAIDLARRAARSTSLDDHDDGRPAPPGAMPSVPAGDERAHATSELDAIERLLRTRYPAGARLIALQREDPDRDDAELAERLGTSKDNVQQIRCRVRRVLADSLSAPADPARRTPRRGG